MKPRGRLLLAEPTGHVTPEDFAQTLDAAASAGLPAVERPPIRGSHAALLQKPASP